MAIVTGGSRGIGRAIVRSLASRGYAVVVNYLHDQRAAESTVERVLADNGSPSPSARMSRTSWTWRGSSPRRSRCSARIDVVVHAVRGRADATPVADFDLEEFDALCRINTRAALVVDREAARRIRDGGAIVSLTSSAVDAPARLRGDAATSAASEALTRVLALELRRGTSP